MEKLEIVHVSFLILDWDFSGNLLFPGYNDVHNFRLPWTNKSQRKSITTINGRALSEAMSNTFENSEAYLFPCNIFSHTIQTQLVVVIWNI